MTLKEFLAATKTEVAERWPELPFLESEFGRAISARGVEGELGELRGAELYLAWRCANGDKGAIDIFDREYLTKIPARLRRIDSSDSFSQEITQRMRERLLVANDGKIRMNDFGGRGSLLSWVQVAAARLALNLRRDEKGSRHVDADEVDLVGDTVDPALQIIKQRHQKDFRAAFSEAIAALTPEERELLRLHFVDGLTLGQIGSMEKVDKSTISRRLTALREQIFAETRRRLEARLGLGHSEFESLMNVVQSQLHLSIERILAK